MVTTRSKTGCLPVAAKVEPRASDVTSKQTRRVQVARPTVRQDSKLLQLPVEILQEILSQADLIDLLNWSLCCRDLNDWLTSKRSLTLWNDAKLNTRIYSHYFDDAYSGRRWWNDRKEKATIVELPPCPQSLRPFCYARLLFLTGCITCGRNIAVRCVHTSSGLQKMCEKCKKTNLVSRSHLKDLWGREDLPKRFWEAIPFGVPKDWGAGPPGANKHAYDLEASEEFLANFQTYEANVGFDSAAISTFIETEIKKQESMLRFLAAFRMWPTIRKEAAREERLLKWEREAELRKVVQDLNRAEIIKRSLSQAGHLTESDVDAALQSLGTLHELDHPIEASEWATLGPMIMKECDKRASDTQVFLLAFNPQSIAFRNAIKPFWTSCLQSFQDTEETLDYVVMPTLYEFSQLPSLSAVRESFKNDPNTTLATTFFDTTGAGYHDLYKNVTSDLRRYSDDLHLQLFTQLGGQSSSLCDALRFFENPFTILQCTECEKVFDASAAFVEHKCTAEKALFHTSFAELGAYYTSREFTAHYKAEIRQSWAWGPKTVPIRSVTSLQLHKEQLDDVRFLLDLLRSYGVELPEDLTKAKLRDITSKLIFTCRDCELHGSAKGHTGRFEGFDAAFAHLIKDSYERWDDNRYARKKHNRLTIEGMASNRRNAGKVVKYTEVEDE